MKFERGELYVAGKAIDLYALGVYVGGLVMLGALGGLPGTIWVVIPSGLIFFGSALLWAFSLGPPKRAPEK